MRASRVVAPRTSVVAELPDPVPAPHEVLVEVLACGVCTSDHRPWREHEGPPAILGHEIVGRVLTTGPSARRWRAGDIVTGMGGQGYATRAVLRADRLMPVPAGIPPELALGEPLARLVEPLRRTALRHHDRVAIIGLGFMGLGLVQLVRAAGAQLLVGVDPSAEARERALALGADAVHAPDEVAETLLAPPGSGRADAGFDVVIEAAGRQAALDTASALIRPHGRLAVIGYHPTAGMHFAVDSRRENIWHKGVTLLGGFTPDPSRLMAALGEGLALVAERRFSYEPLVTHRIGLEELDDAFAMMDSRPAGFVKSVLIPGAA